MVWHSRIEAHEVAPLPISANHLPLHLKQILMGNLIAFQRFNMRCRVRAFNLDAAIISHKPVRAGVSADNGWMLI
jgi:hypothetical protein